MKTKKEEEKGHHRRFAGKLGKLIQIRKLHWERYKNLESLIGILGNIERFHLCIKPCGWCSQMWRNVG